MEINPRIFLSFPWQMVFTTLSVRVFLINILHVSLFLPNVTYSHFAKYNIIQKKERKKEKIEMEMMVIAVSIDIICIF